MDAAQLFDAGQLDEALRAQVQEVKAHPADAGRRTFLFELLGFAGDLDRAQQHLDMIARQSAQSDAAAQVYRNLLLAERKRRGLFADGLRPQFPTEPPESVRHALDAVNRLREGDAAAARQATEQAEEARPERPGQINGEPFDDFRDCDDLLAPVLELFVGPDYYWLPLEQIQTLEFTQPEHPRDLLWLPCQATLTDGSVHRGYSPVLYCGSHAHTDPLVRLGRLTDWNEESDAPVRGVGQRLFLAGDDARAMLDVRTVDFGSLGPDATA